MSQGGPLMGHDMGYSHSDGSTTKLQHAAFVRVSRRMVAEAAPQVSPQSESGGMGKASRSYASRCQILREEGGGLLGLHCPPWRPC